METADPAAPLATSADTDNTETQMEAQPTLLERAKLAAKRRVESGTSPPVSCMLQPTKVHKKTNMAHTLLGILAALNVTVRAVRNTAGGHPQACRGSVTLAVTCDERCMAQSSLKERGCISLLPLSMEHLSSVALWIRHETHTRGDGVCYNK